MSAHNDGRRTRGQVVFTQPIEEHASAAISSSIKSLFKTQCFKVSNVLFLTVSHI
jgi:hypothetical protein